MYNVNDDCNDDDDGDDDDISVVKPSNLILISRRVSSV